MKNREERKIINIYKLALIFLIMGLILMALGAVSGAGQGVHINDSGIHVQRNSNKAQSEKITRTGRFENIRIYARSADVKFIKSDDYGVEITYYGDGYEPVCEIGETEEGFLNVNFKEQGIYLFSWNFSRTKNSVLVCLPESAFIDSVNINTSSGNIDIGDFSASRITINNISGNVNIDRVSADDMSVNVSSGGVTARELFTSGLFVSALSGNVNLSGGFKGETKINASSGNIKIKTNESRDSYSCALSVLSGEITFDGEKMEGKKLNDKTSRDNKLEVTALSGNIEAVFGE